MFDCSNDLGQVPVYLGDVSFSPSLVPPLFPTSSDRTLEVPGTTLGGDGRVGIRVSVLPLTTSTSLGESCNNEIEWTRNYSGSFVKILYLRTIMGVIEDYIT